MVPLRPVIFMKRRKAIGKKCVTYAEITKGSSSDNFQLTLPFSLKKWNTQKTSPKSSTVAAEYQET
ncbi:hypothetical protein RIR_e48376_A0A2N0QI44_9GLOM [Rhizophagus irregularis DAOM 181602=DAOM 197198]|nr:hypothetical protein RIR_e48376_A0A2N0QI44_9GLOM [Rhizophagus irregularis DAOM 181602=DAOM 197198]